MNDSELKARLQNTPVPERSEEYWDDFPARVRVQLHRERRESAPRTAWRPRLSWAGGFALAAVLAFVCIQFQPLQRASAAITQHERQLHAQAAQMKSNLQLLMFNPHGMGYLLAEAN
ncbi:MAG: hypothetical protein P4N60_14760 [Verrucomicrobiae bacterium]|nr:hypothetical protein [Verrucomicrobiae bacterium]